MRTLASLSFALVALALPVPAAVVFSLQGPAGPITLGDSAVFQLSLTSNSGTINNLAGVDFVIEAADPGFTGSGPGGIFTAGTNDLFAPNGGFALPFPSAFQVFGANAGTGLTLTGSPTLLATLTLSTVGATPGTYAANLSSLLAVDPLFNAIPIAIAQGSVTYQIVAPSAVPEPGSLVLLGSGAFILAVIRRRR